MRTNYHVSRWSVVLALCFALLATACQHPMQSSSRAALAVADPPQSLSVSLRDMAIGSDGGGISGLRLCQGEPGSEQCSGLSPSVATRDLGFIPATLSIDTIALTEIQVTNNGWRARAQLKPLVNGVSAWCRPGWIQIEADAAGKTSTTLDSAWCNWLLVGNISVEFSFSTEEIHPVTGMLAGFYEMHIKGTSNASASGYLLAKFE